MNRTVHRTKRRIGAFLALLAALASTAPPLEVVAQPKTSATREEEAATRFKKGFDLFKEGDYRAALIEFRRAYELAPNYVVLYNIGQVYFQLQDYAGALTSFERYLSEGGKEIGPTRREEVRKEIDKLRSRVATLDIAVNVADAEISIDDVPIGKAPLAKPVLVSAGRRKVSATKEGRLPATKVVDIAGTDTLRISLELQESSTTVAPPPIDPTQPQPPVEPTDPPTTPPPAVTTKPPVLPPKPDSGSSAPIVAGWAITGGLTIGAVVFGVVALGASSDLEETRATAGSTRQQLDDGHDKTVTFALVTDILAASAIVAGGVSLYLTLRSPEPSEKAGAKSTLDVGVTPTGVRLFGTF